MNDDQFHDLMSMASQIKAKMDTAGRFRVKFQSSQTNSGIQLQGAVAERFGTFVSMSMVPSGPGQLSPVFLILPDDEKLPVVVSDVQFL